MKGTVKDFLSRHLFECGILLLYFIITFSTVLFHEPWRDEAQVWLLARDLSIPGLLKEMGYDGSPALWHLLVMPLAKCGMPYFSMSILNVLIATAAAGVFLFHAPFSRLIKVLFVLSYYMIYEYSVIARSYALSVLFIFIIAALFRERKAKPLIYGLMVALLFNTNTHNFIPGAAFMLISLYDLLKNKDNSGNKGKEAAGLAIMFLGAIFALYQLIPPADSWKPGLINDISWFAPFEAVADAFLPTCLLNPGMTLFDKHWSEMIFFFAFLIIAGIYLYWNKRAFFFFCFSFAGLCYIFIFKHSGYLRHFGFILIFLLVALWIVESDEGSSPAGKVNEAGLPAKSFPDFGFLRKFIFAFLGLTLLTSVITGGCYIVLDINRPFSGAKAMAGYLKDHHITEHFIAAYNIHTMVAILPYLPGIKFWDPGLNADYTFIHWDDHYLPTRHIPAGIILDKVKAKTASMGRSYLILPYALPIPEDGGFRLMYRSDENVTGDEKYYLYQPLIQKDL